jgi:hypothetical protein
LRVPPAKGRFSEMRYYRFAAIDRNSTDHPIENPSY